MQTPIKSLYKYSTEGEDGSLLVRSLSHEEESVDESSPAVVTDPDTFDLSHETRRSLDNCM